MMICADRALLTSCSTSAGTNQQKNLHPTTPERLGAHVVVQWSYDGSRMVLEVLAGQRLVECTIAGLQHTQFDYT